MVKRHSIIPGAAETIDKEIPTCRHYWLIDSPQGPTSRGVCKFCGAVKEFHNSWSALASIWTRSSPGHSRPTEPADTEPDAAEDTGNDWEDEA